MYRKNHTRAYTRNLVGVAGAVVLSACSSAAPEPVSVGENTSNVPAALLSATCTVTAGNLALVVNTNEIGYVGKVAGCTVEPCVFANAIDATGAICRIPSTGGITVTSGGAGTEKMVIDYSNGLFALATSAVPLVSVTLPATTSRLMVIPPVGGGNMALGTGGLDANTLVARGTPRVDVTISPQVDFLFSGGAGKDVFTGDVAGWTTAPAGWASGAAIAAAVGTPTILNLTVNGGANDDILAGGAGTSSLLGGAGNDTFLQSATVHAETMNGGDGFDTVDYGFRANPVHVSLGTSAGIAAVTAAPVAAGTGYVVGDILTLPSGKLGAATVTVASIVAAAASGPIATVTLTTPGSGYVANVVAGATTTNSAAGTGATITTTAFNAPDDGEPAEGDVVGSTIEIVKGGAGDDILNAYAITLTDVVLMGQGGNDKLTGGSLNDDLCGGTGDDTFYTNPGNDNVVGGTGLDTVDYSAGTGVIACLNSADTALTKPCAAQNGPTGEQDVVNNAALAKVCPRATLRIDVGGVPTAAVPVPTTIQGGPMVVDVENLTGNPAVANELHCGTLACTLFGGTGDDFLYGGAASDIIIGGGGADTVKTNGSNDLVDLTHTGGTKLQTVDCANSQSTLLISAVDTTSYAGTCNFANTP